MSSWWPSWLSFSSNASPIPATRSVPHEQEAALCHKMALPLLSAKQQVLPVAPWRRDFGMIALVDVWLPSSLHVVQHSKLAQSVLGLIQESSKQDADQSGSLDDAPLESVLQKSGVHLKIPESLLRVLFVAERWLVSRPETREELNEASAKNILLLMEYLDVNHKEIRPLQGYCAGVLMRLASAYKPIFPKEIREKMDLWRQYQRNCDQWDARVLKLGSEREELFKILPILQLQNQDSYLAALLDFSLEKMREHRYDPGAMPYVRLKIDPTIEGIGCDSEKYEESLFRIFGDRELRERIRFVNFSEGPLDLYRFLQYFPKLETLDISKCHYSVRPLDFLPDLSKGCSKLETLCVSTGQLFQFEERRPGVKYFKRNECASVAHIPNLWISWEKIPWNLTDLEKLNWSGHEEIRFCDELDRLYWPSQRTVQEEESAKIIIDKLSKREKPIKLYIPEDHYRWSFCFGQIKDHPMVELHFFDPKERPNSSQKLVSL